MSTWGHALVRHRSYGASCSTGLRCPERKGNASALALYVSAYKHQGPGGREATRRSVLCQTCAERFAEKHALRMPEAGGLS